MVNQQQTIRSHHLAVSNLYLELVQQITHSIPIAISEVVSQQLMQLNCMFSRQLSIYPSLSLEGDQYRAYTFIIQNFNESKRKGLHFFVTVRQEQENHIFFTPYYHGLRCQRSSFWF